MSNINYSIIIPHKNIPQLLQRCLDSIPIRDDVQVIVVDDNSDTDKVNFDNFPKWKGKNYEYYLTKEGKGAGYARNVGLEHTKGEWLLFADADDYFLSSINILFENIDSYKAEDIIYFRPTAERYDTHEACDNLNFINDYIDNYIKTGEASPLRVWWDSPWGKLIRHSLIKKGNIRFEEIKYGNDHLFVVKAGCAADKIALFDETCYVYTIRKFSLTSDFMKKPGEIACRAETYIKSLREIQKTHYKYDELTTLYFLNQTRNKDIKHFCQLFNYLNEIQGIRKIDLLRSSFNSYSRMRRWMFYAKTLILSKIYRF